MNNPPENVTINSLLDSSEELFAQRGYDGATMREITSLAGVNLAAAHYHLGDKAALYALVLSRRLQPINESRLASLKQAESQAAGQPVPMARIFDILARPLYELPADSSKGSRHFARLFGRCLTDPLPFSEKMLAKEFQPVMARFGQAVRRHVPDLAPEEFLWRFSFVIGAMHHSLATLHRMKDLTRGICRDNDRTGALQRFVPFAVAAIRVTAQTGAESSSSWS